MITLAFGSDTLNVLGEIAVTGEPLTFSLTLLQNVGNWDFFTEEMLDTMLRNTRLLITSESEGRDT